MNIPIEQHNMLLEKYTPADSIMKVLEKLDVTITQISNRTDIDASIKDLLIWRYLVEFYCIVPDDKVMSKSIMHKLLTLNAVIDDEINTKLSVCTKLGERRCTLFTDSLYLKYPDSIPKHIIRGLCSNLNTCMILPSEEMVFTKVAHTPFVVLDDSILTDKTVEKYL